MTVSLPPQFDAYVRDLVEGGAYSSADDVVRDGLRLLREKRERDEKVGELSELIREGLESPVVRVTRDEVRALMRERMAELRDEVARGDRPAPGEAAA